MLKLKVCEVFDMTQVKESDMSKEVIEDYEGSLEYASAERLIKMKKRGDQRLYLVKYELGYPFCLNALFSYTLHIF